MIGIYKIINLINGKKYYGSSIDIESRWVKHKSMLRGNYHDNSHLQNSWNKYGEGKFKFEILLYCEEFELLKYEQWFLDNIVRWGVDYNVAKCAKAPMLKRKHSEETKKRMSEVAKGREIMWGDKISLAVSGKNNSMYGKRLTKEHREKISKSNMGKNSGENCGTSKLIKERVLIIRRMHLTEKYTQEVLGKLFTVSQNAIFKIVSYKTWKHI